MLCAFKKQYQQKDPIISIQAPEKAALRPFVSQHEITLLSSTKFLLVISCVVFLCLWVCTTFSALYSPPARAAIKVTDSSYQIGNNILHSHAEEKWVK